MFIQALKTHARQLSLIITLTILSILLLLFHLSFVANEKSVSQSQVVNKASRGLPVHLKIPAINVNASIQHVGVTANKDMAVPSNTVDVGWFKFGPRPGEVGSAVIAGHFDGEDDQAGVFTNLHKLKGGDKVYVEDAKGTTTLFIVRESRIYDPDYAYEVFRLSGSAYLNLVTCDGVWDGVKKSYSKRLVVFADIAH